MEKVDIAQHLEEVVIALQRGKEDIVEHHGKSRHGPAAWKK